MFGWIADKWGRRTALFAILFLEVIFSIATSFSPNYVIYTALRTVNGLSFPAIYQIPFILGTLRRGFQLRGVLQPFRSPRHFCFQLWS